MAEPNIIIDSSEVEEIWKPIVGYEGLYSVSNLGRIWGHYRHHLLKLQMNWGGYVTATLCREAKIKVYMAHRLVAIAFIGSPPENRPFINHRDGCKTNNRPANLEWCSHAENCAHAAIMGLVASGDRNSMRARPECINRGDDHWSRRMPERRAFGMRNGQHTKPEKTVRGEHHPRSKLTEQQVVEIRAKYIPRKYTLKMLAQEYGVDPSIIHDIVHRRLWTHI